MIARLLSVFQSPAPARSGNVESRLALAALMVRLARADGHYDRAEARRIDLVLSSRYGLSAPAAAQVRDEAEMIEAAAPDTVRFTRALKDAVPHEERMGLIAAMWQVALSDRARDADEDALIRLVASLLGISDKDNALARRQVGHQG